MKILEAMRTHAIHLIRGDNAMVDASGIFHSYTCIVTASLLPLRLMYLVLVPGGHDNSDSLGIQIGIRGFNEINETLV